MMSHYWKLIRQGPFESEYEILPGEWPVGRDNENKINCPSIVVSRRHCLITVLDDGFVYVKDLKSSNGTYIDLKKLTPLETYKVEENKKIGIGINETKNEVRNESDKFIFKLIKVSKVAEHVVSPSQPCPGKFCPSLKRKAEPERAVSPENIQPQYFDAKQSNKTEKENKNANEQTDNRLSVINLLSDSDSDDELIFKRIKLEKPSQEEHTRGLTVEKPNNLMQTNQEMELSNQSSKSENANKHLLSEIKVEPSTQSRNGSQHSDIDKAAEIPFDLFNLKMEYDCDYDDPIEIDSDSEDDSQIWFKRLSQSSPGRPSLVSQINASIKAEDDEDIDLSDSPELINNIISSPILVEDELEKIDEVTREEPDHLQIIDKVTREEPDHLVSIDEVTREETDHLENIDEQTREEPDEVDGNNKLSSIVNEEIFNVIRKSSVKSNDLARQIEIIEPHHIVSRRRSHSHVSAKNRTKSSKSEGSSTSRRKSVDVKDERRKKLKEIACKKKEDEKLTKPAALPNVKQKDCEQFTPNGSVGVYIAEPQQKRAKCQPPNLHSGEFAPPPTDRNFGPVSITVNFSMPRNNSLGEPRVGDLLVLHSGEEKKHFYYVQNVRRLPSPPNNVNSFFQFTLSTVYRDTLRNLRPGQELKAQNLGFIKNMLTLILSVDYLRGSPLIDIIVRPEPEYFARAHLKEARIEKSKWTAHLNLSQMEAVESSVHAALSDQPSIQLVQGPPGTGKSSVICSIVMRYFYGNTKKRHANRNKLLICTTSNAAVDELVLRLLNIRKTLPKPERFRMVRVGREAAMAPEAWAVSSQKLAHIDLHRVHETRPERDEEIMFLEAKVNSWKSAAESASQGNASRAAYCADRARHFSERLARVRMALGDSGGGMNAPPSAEHLNACEQRVIEGADIIMTTLASCANQKLKCLRRRIALCIIDEAGQAIEPEALLPLALDVSRLTLIGDPQQLPGFIASQRAKQHGLGESLFCRISHCAADWDVNPVILLDQQYRMHPEIALYPNKTFYKGLVGNGAKLRNNFPLPPYRMLYISSGDNGQAPTGVNEMEAWAVSRVVLELSAVAKAQAMSLAVITPYRAHKDCILSCLNRLQGDSPAAIEVNTIDSFQGQERDIVVVSLARSHGLGFSRTRAA